MAFHRGFGREPVGRLSGSQELRFLERSSVLATGTLACPHCDAPVVIAVHRTPADGLVCPYCLHSGRVRDFLSLAAPTRPARVQVRVVRRERLG